MEAKSEKSSRRENRIAAMQFLYQYDIHPEASPLVSFSHLLESLGGKRAGYEFAETLITGVLQHRIQIDQTLQRYLQNWTFSRVAKIDLAILRLGIYELLFRDDIPPVVTINETIELGKQFSDANAKRFINGILDEIKKNLQRPFRQSAGH